MTYKPRAIRAYWNKDMSITLRSGNDKIDRIAGVDSKARVEAFLEGWFGTADKSQWKVRWYFA